MLHRQTANVRLAGIAADDGTDCHSTLGPALDEPGALQQPSTVHVSEGQTTTLGFGLLRQLPPATDIRCVKLLVDATCFSAWPHRAGATSQASYFPAAFLSASLIRSCQRELSLSNLSCRIARTTRENLTKYPVKMPFVLWHRSFSSVTLQFVQQVFSS